MPALAVHSAGEIFKVTMKLFIQLCKRNNRIPFLTATFSLLSAIAISGLALVADTPFALAVPRGEQIAPLATIFESRKSIAIVACRDGGITGAESLGGKSVATLTNTNAQYFLDTMLDIHGIARKTVEITGFKPAQLAAALE